MRCEIKRKKTFKITIEWKKSVLIICCKWYITKLWFLILVLILSVNYYYFYIIYIIVVQFSDASVRRRVEKYCTRIRWKISVLELYGRTWWKACSYSDTAAFWFVFFIFTKDITASFSWQWQMQENNLLWSMQVIMAEFLIVEYCFTQSSRNYINKEDCFCQKQVHFQTHQILSPMYSQAMKLSHWVQITWRTIL